MARERHSLGATGADQRHGSSWGALFIWLAATMTASTIPLGGIMAQAFPGAPFLWVMLAASGCFLLVGIVSIPGFVYGLPTMVVSEHLLGARVNRVISAANWLSQVRETEAAMRRAMSELRVPPDDVHLVHVKAALPAVAPGAIHPPRCTMVHARAASALGVAAALGEVDGDALTDDAIATRLELYSQVANVSAKPGVCASEILVFANSPYWDSPCRIHHAVMRDIIDIEPVRALLATAGLSTCGQLAPDQARRIRAIFAKSDADPSHSIRGRRHTMWTDEDFSDMRYSRCVVGAVLAALTGTTAVYVSTRAEHMGPPGGGPVAVIVDET